MNKKKGHRSSVKKGYYERQYAKTEANKGRKAARRKRRADHWAKIKAASA